MGQGDSGSLFDSRGNHGTRRRPLSDVPHGALAIPLGREEIPDRSLSRN
jgi:hypothetical protein